MREHFVRELEHLEQALVAMSDLVVRNIEATARALEKEDQVLADGVMGEEERVNSQELEITDLCASLIAREQPVASDLRKVVSILKVVSDVERIGDYAVHAAKRVRSQSEEARIPAWKHVPAMLQVGGRMLRAAVQALVENNEDLARSTARMDDELDKMKRQIYQELLTVMVKEPQAIKQGTKLLFLSRFLERMGDHAVNICSWAVYSTTGAHEEL